MDAETHIKNIHIEHFFYFINHISATIYWLLVQNFWIIDYSKQMAPAFSFSHMKVKLLARFQSADCNFLISQFYLEIFLEAAKKKKKDIHKVYKMKFNISTFKYFTFQHGSHKMFKILCITGFFFLRFNASINGKS